MMKTGLSKSRYCKALQCPKILWMSDHMPEAFDASVLNQGVFETGNAVGDLAMGLYGPYQEVPYGEPSAMIEATNQLLVRNTPVITEASFSYDGCFCSVDILVCHSDGSVDLCEVKSSTGVREIYLDDLAYQYYVLSNCGLKVHAAKLIYLNKFYERIGELDLNELFIEEDHTRHAIQRAKAIKTLVNEIRAYMEQETEPEEPIGMHCSVPYDCGFFPHCLGNVPSPNVFDLAATQLNTKLKFYEEGLVSFEELYQSGRLNPKQTQQVRFDLEDLPPAIAVDEIRSFLKEIHYPVYFLDFEAYNPAIPPYDHTRPYQPVVFQYSLHFYEAEGAKLEHREFLAMPGSDPRRALAEQLCRDIPGGVTVIAYNMTYEKTRIKELAALFPDLREHLLDINAHMVDLMVPFARRWYYAKGMDGSYSIKKVLPALFPDDPELDYHSLEGVHNGMEASDAFRRMADMGTEELNQYRTFLLKYCGLDTYAMVKIFDHLKGI